MKRNVLLVLVAILGAVAVGALFLLSGGGPGGARATTDGGGRGGGRVTARGGGPVVTGGQVVTPEMARNRQGGGTMIGSTVQPGLRERFDSPEEIEARERNAGRIEELIRDLLDPKLDPNQKWPKSQELERLLRLMGHRVSPDVRKKLLDMLATGANPSVKMQMGSLIGALDGDTDTAKALLEMLRTSDDVDTRRAVYSALGRMNVQDVTPTLLSMLGQGLGDEEVFIIRAIGNLAKPEEVDQLFARLDQPLNGASRTEIEQVLQQRGRIPGFFDKVALGLDEADAPKRRSLLRILSASTNPDHAAKVRELLKHEADPESRAIAIQALGKYGDAESGKVLLELVQTGSPDQQRAIQAINGIRNRETIAELATPTVWAGLTGDGRIAVMGAVSRIPAATEPMIGLAQERGLVDAELLVRTASARTLGIRGRDAGVEALVVFLERSTHPAERSAALDALERIRTRKAALAAIQVLRIVPSERERARLEKVFKQIADEPDPRNPEQSR